MLLALMVKFQWYRGWDCCSTHYEATQLFTETKVAEAEIEVAIFYSITGDKIYAKLFKLVNSLLAIGRVCRIWVIEKRIQ